MPKTNTAKTNTKPFQNKLNLVGTIVFYILLFGGLALILTRSNNDFWSTVPIFNALQLHAHVTNLVLGMQLLLATGLSALIARRASAWKTIFVAAVVILLLNVVMEVFITLGNVRDTADIIAGVAGVALGLAGLYLIDRFGIEATK